MNECGVIYILTRHQKYVPIITTSVTSLKKHMPDVHVTAFSEFPLDGPFDRVVPVQHSSYSDGFYDKTRFIAESPYERTLFLDCDIYVVRPVPELFPLLDHFDCALTHEEYHNTDWNGDYPRPDIPPSFPEFNTGVFLYRKSEKMMQLFRSWEALHREYRDQYPDGRLDNDQPFFRPAAYYSDARIATLGREYNCKFRGQGYLNGPVKLLHGHVKFEMKPEHLEKANQVLNRGQRPRVYIAGKVFQQEVYGRLWATSHAKSLGRFPLETVSLWKLKLRRLRQIGVSGIIRKALGK